MSGKGNGSAPEKQPLTPAGRGRMEAAVASIAMTFSRRGGLGRIVGARSEAELEYARFLLKRIAHRTHLVDLGQREKLAYIEAARRIYAEEGTLEIDDDASVSPGDDPGAYVQAWVWVEDAELEKGK